MHRKERTETPDFDWYAGESGKLRLSPRCPIAHVELCPRYYESTFLLGQEKLTTAISPERNATLEKKWKSLGSVTGEEGASIWGDGKHKNLSHFCPEVSYEIYGYFASELTEYPDEEDRDIAYRLYEQGKIKHLDPRWMQIGPRHYTECREYSIFATFAGGKPSKVARPGEVSPKRRWEVFERDKRTCVYCGRRPPEVKLQVDHRVSIKDGGTDDLDNLVTACDTCNRGKGASSLPDESKPTDPRQK